MAEQGRPQALSVVTQLRDLASEPQNREVIVRDHGCLPGLVLFLDHHDADVVFSALQALRYLAESAANRERMRSELGMLLSLQNIIDKKERLHEAGSLAAEIHELLTRPAGATTAVPGGGGGGGGVTTRPRKGQFFLGNTNKKAKVVTLHIDGLTDGGRRSLCEDALLKVRGVISFTFQMASQRCVVRIRTELKAECLASAIAATKVMSAQQVIKNESGEEVLLSLEQCSEGLEENEELPDYLPEEESPVRQNGRAVSRVGAKKDAGGSWLSSAASFLTKSFYW